MEIRLSGFGGQGIIRMGMILGRAAALHAGKEATLTQSFGPEARGGACSAQLVISDHKILYPYVTRPDLLVTMSQEAHERFEPELADNGLLFTDADLVRPHAPRAAVRCYSVPATRIAEGLGNRLYANMVMLGFVVGVSACVPREAVLAALPGAVPERLLAQNLAAFDRGFALGREQLAAG